MSKNGKVKEFVKEHKCAILACVCTGLGAVIGYKYAVNRMDQRIGLLCTVNPELKTAIQSTVDLVKMRCA